MAQQMNEDQRLRALEAYNPKEHLIPVGKDRQGKVTLYLPAAWRLYELNLRYPNANFKSEIIYHNEEKGFVIVKAYLYLGANYADSDKKAEAMKQGSINILDKVETAAKARAARDFGIGTEYALDIEADETDARHDTETRQNAHPIERIAEQAEPPKPVRIEAQTQTEALQSGADHKATEQQRTAIASMAQRLGKRIELTPDTSFQDAAAQLQELSKEWRDAQRAKTSVGAGR